MNKKLWVGILTFVPLLFTLLYLVLFVLFFSTFITDVSQLSEDEIASYILRNLSWIIGLIFINVVVSLGLLVYYLVHVNRSPQLDTNLKILWSILLIISITISGIVYYFLYILPENISQIKTNDKNRFQI
ncbi:MAG TPA: hypothetical protein VKZ42_03190 [Flavobacteriaceae bacterium]|nr:hypothetical protein [Flavobacteriaceae bacterium]